MIVSTALVKFGFPFAFIALYYGLNFGDLCAAGLSVSGFLYWIKDITDDYGFRG